ncbi:hypothetical protein ACFSCW_09705 [Sphingomonas tabacisoli]|uniref:Uncharacterized protein n=1 Tax=Sphingomonas tabacisoli TaxID=2249466 RepID=A0ABW4I2B8_9SPHN
MIDPQLIVPEVNHLRAANPQVLQLLQLSGVHADLSWTMVPEGGSDLDFLLELEAIHDQTESGAGWSEQVRAELRRARAKWCAELGCIAAFLI